MTCTCHRNSGHFTGGAPIPWNPGTDRVIVSKSRFSYFENRPDSCAAAAKQLALFLRVAFACDSGNLGAFYKLGFDLRLLSARPVVNV